MIGTGNSTNLIARPLINVLISDHYYYFKDDTLGGEDRRSFCSSYRIFEKRANIYQENLTLTVDGINGV